MTKALPALHEEKYKVSSLGFIPLNLVLRSSALKNLLSPRHRQDYSLKAFFSISILTPSMNFLGL